MTQTLNKSSKHLRSYLSEPGALQGLYHSLPNFTVSKTYVERPDKTAWDSP